eukprot:COSAG02_NODE_192_length_29942_cov_34.627228_8_plen_57_part_00
MEVRAAYDIPPRQLVYCPASNGLVLGSWVFAPCCVCLSELVCPLWHARDNATPLIV